VFAFVNNNFRANQSRAASFLLNATTPSGANWFGIQPSHLYNVVDLASTNPAALLWGPGIQGSTLIANGLYVGFQPSSSFAGGQVQYIRLLDITAGMGPTNVNDMFLNESRIPAPVINGLSNRTVAVSNTLAFTLNVTKATNDVVTLECLSTLPPGTWSFTGPGNFSFTPTNGQTGVHTFLFRAVGIDGFDEEQITVTVTTADDPTEYELWADSVGLDPDGANGGVSDDYDFDGQNNYAEFLADTSPTNPLSFLQVKGMTLSGTTLNLSMDKASAAPRAYVIHTATQLSGQDWNWALMGTNQSTTGVLPVNDPASPVLLFKVTIPPPAP